MNKKTDMAEAPGMGNITAPCGGLRPIGRCACAEGVRLAETAGRAAKRTQGPTQTRRAERVPREPGTRNGEPGTRMAEAIVYTDVCGETPDFATEPSVQLAAQAKAIAAQAVASPSNAAEEKMALELSLVWSDAELSKNAMLMRAVRFGALFENVRSLLMACRGRPKDRETTMKEWLARNCPEINYNTAKVYALMARKAEEMLGGGIEARAALSGLEKVTLASGESVAISASVKEARDALFGTMQSRRDLEKAYVKYSHYMGAKPGRPEGTLVREYRRKTALEIATMTVYPIIEAFTAKRMALITAYRLLPRKKLEEALATLTEQCAAINAEIVSRTNEAGLPAIGRRDK